MTTDSQRPDDRSQAPERDADPDMRDLFRRTAPIAPPVDIQALLGSACVRIRAPRPRLVRTAAAAAAAIILAAAGAMGGWVAGRSAAAGESRRFEGAIAEARAEIASEVSRALAGFHSAFAEDQQDAFKRLAVLLRNDYGARIAAVRQEVRELAMAEGGTR